MTRKPISLLIILLGIVGLTSPTVAQSNIVAVFHEDFNDGELLTNPFWFRILHPDNYAIIDGQLHPDGWLGAGSDGRAYSEFMSDAAGVYLAPDFLEISFRGLLKSQGNPQSGTEIYVATFSTTAGFGEYALRIGTQHGWPNESNNGIAFQTGDPYRVNDLIRTSYPPLLDHMYQVRVVRQVGEWSLFVDGALVGSVADPWGWTELHSVKIATVGSVVIDDLEIRVAAPNSAPNAIDDIISTNEDVSTTINVTANDTDPDDNLDPASTRVISGPSAGSLGDSGNGIFTYVPDSNYNGEDSFIYQVCDTEGACDTAIVSITISPINDPPIVTVAQPAVAVNEGQNTANSGGVSDVEGDNVTLSASVGSVTSIGDGTWSWSFTTTDGPAESQPVTIYADDGHGGTALATFNLIVNNVVPIVEAGSDQTVFRNDTVVFSGAFSDPGALDIHTIAWNLGDGSTTSDTLTPTHVYPVEGVYQATLTVADKDGGVGVDTLTVTVQNRLPVCDNVFPSQDFLWPPQHQMESVNILGVTDPEGDPTNITITAIFQDEPTNGLGDGDTSPDGQGVGAGSAIVRAERAGDGNGRMYHISFTANDGHGGNCEGTVLVGVNHDQGKKGQAVDDGSLYDSTAQ